MNELVDTAGPGRALTQHQEVDANSGNVLAMVLQAARDPEIDADKMKTLAELAMRIRNDERETQFNRDLNAAKKEMPSIGRSGEIKNNAGKVQSRFSSWEKLNPIVSEVLAKHNLTIGHEIGSAADGKISIIPILTHDNGMERRGSEMTFPPDTTGNKSAAQAVVSSASYGQRVTTIKLLNIRTHDAPDLDGNAGGIDAYEQLSPELRQLVDDAHSKAGEGTAAYEEFYKGLSVAHRGHLTFNQAWPSSLTWHAQNKQLADKIG